ncbi:MAG: HAD family hydrolase, partial [Anaerorhabdus sp.]
IEKAQEQAMRIIAFAHKSITSMKDFEEETSHKELESNMEFDGFVAIADPLRKEVFEAVNSCRKAGIDLKILTGDNIVTATAIANELRILNEQSIAIEASQ